MNFTPDILKLSTQQWVDMIKTQELSEDFLFFYASHIPDSCWNRLATYQKLTEKFIIDFNYKLDISILLTSQVVHEKTIRENMQIFQEYLWHACRYQYLSEEFINEFQDQLHWGQLFLNQDHLSISFISKNISRFPKEYIYDPLDIFHKSILEYNKKLILNFVQDHNKKIRTVEGTIRTRF
jgi:hypothetical protein